MDQKYGSHSCRFEDVLPVAVPHPKMQSSRSFGARCVRFIECIRRQAVLIPGIAIALSLGNAAAGIAATAALVALPGVAQAQTIPGCEFPPVDEPDGDGDECYAPPDPQTNLGDPNGSDTNIPTQPGQSGGEPVNFTTGNMFMFQRDYSSVSAFPLDFTRVYNSQSTAAGSLGAHWSHNFADHVVTLSATSVRVVKGDSKAILFSFVNGRWIAAPSINSRLVQLTDNNGGVLGWQYLTGDDMTEIFDAAGRLTSRANRAGVTQSLTYDSAGLLTAVTGGFGRVIQLSYDGSGHITRMTDPAGRQYEYAYDAANNLTSVTYPDGTARTYVYENTAAPNRMTGMIDENGVRYVTWTYNGAGRVSSSALADGIDGLALSYDFFNGTTTVTDALNHRVRYDYITFDGVEHTLHVNQPAVNGGTTRDSWIYDNNGNVSTHIDFLGHATNYTFDQTRNLEVRRALPDGQVINTTYDPRFRLATLIRSANSSDERTYDAGGNMIQRTLRDVVTGTSRTANYTYNDAGQLLTATDPNGNVYTLTYDAAGNLATATDPLSHTTTFEHDANGRVTRMVDPNGLVTRYAYDARDRLISKQVGAEQYRYRYDAAGNLIELDQPSGFNLTFGYDDAHRLVSVVDSFGNRIEYTLDAMSNRIGEMHFDANGNQVYTHGWRYDALNRLVQGIGAVNQTTVFSYDNDSNLRRQTDPLAHVTAYFYDRINRLAQVTAPDGGSTTLTYNIINQLTVVTDPRRLPTQYTVDALGNLTRVTSPDAGTGTLAQDANGNVVRRVDGNGNTLLFRYDALNRVTAIVRTDTNQTLFDYTYDQVDSRHGHGVGHLTSMSNPESTTDYRYDRHGRVVRKVQRIGGARLETRYKFGRRSGNLREMVLPSGTVMRYEFTNGRVSAASLRRACRHDVLIDLDNDHDRHAGRDPDFDFRHNGKHGDKDDGARLDLDCDTRPLLTDVTWEPFSGPLQWTLGNGETDARRYDLDGRIVADSVDGAIDYDAASRISGVTLGGTANGTRAYTYDVVGRLTGLTSGDGSLDLGFSYDLNGNRLALRSNGQPLVNYTIDSSSNRVLASSFGNIEYTYDGNGSTTSEGLIVYAYDRVNRLASATTASGVTRYFYNGLGQRLEKRGDSATLYYYDEAGHLLGEYTATGRPIEETLYLGNISVAVVKPRGTFFVHTDYRNTPRQIDDMAQHPVWTWDPVAFGLKPPNENPTGTASGGFVYNLRFPGQVFDAETGLHYNYFRYYNPRIGRYISSDPIGLRGGLNTFAYVNDDPLKFSDSLGLWAGGFSVDVSTINPFTSGGGGSYGVNLEYTSDAGLHLYYFYTPNDVTSVGFQPGFSATGNLATGTGDWTGPFESGNGSFGPFTGGFFHTPSDQPEPGYFGGQFGFSFGPPGIGFTRTEYNRLFPDSSASCQ